MLYGVCSLIDHDYINAYIFSFIVYFQRCTCKFASPEWYNKNINNIIASPTAAHPSLVDGFTDQFVQTGQRAALRCIAAGNPTPVVNWTLDGEPVKHKTHVSFGDFTDLSGDVISYVNITSVRLEDGGEYRCIVSNDVGEVEHTARLNVYGNVLT